MPVESHERDGISLGYEFDEVGNLKRQRDGNQADPPERIYGYDALNRLTEVKDVANVVWQSYSYDKTGNGQTAGWREVVAQQDCTGVGPGEPCAPLPPTTQWKTDAYGYQSGTHRLFTRNGRQRSYDNAGNLILDLPVSGEEGFEPPPGDGETESAAYAGTMQTMDDASGGMERASPGAVARSYSYNAANRMSGTSLAGEHLMSYRHNGRGERVYRQGIDRTVHTVFDPAGHWIGDYDAEGAIIQQAIWFGDLPVGLLARDGGTTRLFHVEPDMLGSPRAVIDPARGTNGTVVWRWDLAGEAFGNDRPNEDPDGDGTAFVLDMRFPGQQYDSASGLNYNYFRDYEAATGRYVESDPIGLDGGINTFSYASNSPLWNTDSYGLSPDCKKCGLIRAPEYHLQGTIPSGTGFAWGARFKTDEKHDPACCEVRQYISWDKPLPTRYGSPHTGFPPPYNRPGAWYEDRDSNGNRYGRRSGPYHDPGPHDSYHGDTYYGTDAPSGPPTPGNFFRFRIDVIDVCDKSSTEDVVVHRSRVLNVRL